MARYAGIADLAAEATWQRIAEAAAKGELLVPGEDGRDRRVTGADLEAAVETPPVADSVMAQVVARVERGLEGACAIVDTYVKVRYPEYSQPVRAAGDPPTTVTLWTIDLALERLLGQGEGDEWRHRGDNARKALEALARGDLDLAGDIDGDGIADDVAGEVLVGGSERVFTRESLAGFTGR